MAMLAHGIDVSTFQGRILWDELRGKIELAYVRTTHGARQVMLPNGTITVRPGFIDYNAAENIRGAREIGVRYRGYYHLLTGSEPPEAQADFFRDAVQAIGGLQTPGEFIVLDWETVDQKTGELAPIEYVYAWLERTAAWAPGRSLVYASRSLLDLLDGSLPRILASYTGEEARAAGEARGAVIVQWTSQGVVDGILSWVDLNEILDREALDRLSGYVEGDDMSPLEFTENMARCMGGEVAPTVDGNGEVVFPIRKPDGTVVRPNMRQALEWIMNAADAAAAGDFQATLDTDDAAVIGAAVKKAVSELPWPGKPA